MREDNRYLLNFIMNDERAKSYIEKNDYDEIIYKDYMIVKDYLELI